MNELHEKIKNSAVNLIDSNIMFVEKALVESENGKLIVNVKFDIERNLVTGVININPQLKFDKKMSHVDKQDMIIIDPNQPDMFDGEL